MFRTASHNSKLSAHLSFFINNRELSLNSPPLEINSLEAKPTNEDLRVLMVFPAPSKVLLQQGQDGRHLQHQPSERKERGKGEVLTRWEGVDREKRETVDPLWF